MPILDDIGDITQLTTTDKFDLVSAINELVTETDTNAVDILQNSVDIQTNIDAITEREHVAEAFAIRLLAMEVAQGTISVSLGSSIQTNSDAIAAGDVLIVANTSATNLLTTRVVLTEDGLSTQGDLITNLSASLASTDGILSGTSTAVGSLITRTDIVEGNINTQSSDIAALTSRVTGTEGVANAVSAANQTLTTRVNVTEGLTTSQGQSLTNLEARVDLTEGVADGAASAGALLEARVTSAEGSYVTQGLDLVALTTRVTDTESDITGGASAVAALTTEVSVIDGIVSSQATDLVTLQSSISSLSAPAWVDDVAYAVDDVFHHIVNGVTTFYEVNTVTTPTNPTPPNAVYTVLPDYVSDFAEQFAEITVLTETVNGLDTQWEVKSTIGGLVNSVGFYNDGGGLRFAISNNGTEGLVWDGSNLSIQGSITITAGSSGYSSFVDRPVSLAEINGSEGTKLTNLPADADATNYTDGRISNDQISINANGTLNGAGGGAVTTSGIGAETPSDAQTKADTAESNAATDATNKANDATPFTLNNTANMTIVGSKITKTSGATGWNAAAHTSEKYTAGAYASVRASQSNQPIMFGLSDTGGANDTYTDIDYAIYLTSGAALILYVNGANNGTLGTYATGDILTITYDNVKVQCWKNGIAVGSSLYVTSGQRLGFDSSFNNTGSSLESIQFGPLASMDYASIDGGPPSDATNGATWGVNVTPPVRFSENATVGLNLTSAHMGYNNGLTGAANNYGWVTYMQSNGDFFLKGDDDNFLSWDASASTLSVKGTIHATTVEASAINATHINGLSITGVTVTSGTFQTAATGSERAVISGATNTFQSWWNDGATGGLRDIVEIGNLTVGSDKIAIRAGKYGYPYAGTGVYATSIHATMPSIVGHNKASRGIGVRGASDYGTAIHGEAFNDGCGVMGKGAMPFNNASFDGGMGNFKAVTVCLIKKSNYTSVASPTLTQGAMNGRCVEILSILNTTGDTPLFEVQLQQSVAERDNLGIIQVVRSITTQRAYDYAPIHASTILASYPSTTYDLCLVYTSGIAMARVNTRVDAASGNGIKSDGNNGELYCTNTTTYSPDFMGKTLATAVGAAGSATLIPVMLGAH